GREHATPIIWRERLFLLSADHDREQIILGCHHAVTGRETWQTAIHRTGFQTVREKSSHVLSTPLCDGQFIYTVAAAHGQLLISSIDMKGQIAWQKPAGPYRSAGGYLSS